MTVALGEGSTASLLSKGDIKLGIIASMSMKSISSAAGPAGSAHMVTRCFRRGRPPNDGFLTFWRLDAWVGLRTPRSTGALPGTRNAGLIWKMHATATNRRKVTSRCAVTDCPCEMAALFSNRGERFTVLMYVGCRSTCFTQLFKTLSVVINNSRHILVVWSSFPKFTGLTPRLNTYGDHAVPPTGVYVAVNVWRLNSNCWVLLPFQIPLGDAFP
eukprot:3675273-Rhodomonas_salina.1